MMKRELNDNLWFTILDNVGKMLIIIKCLTIVIGTYKTFIYAEKILMCQFLRYTLIDTHCDCCAISGMENFQHFFVYDIGFPCEKKLTG